MSVDLENLRSIPEGTRLYWAGPDGRLVAKGVVGKTVPVEDESAVDYTITAPFDELVPSEQQIDIHRRVGVRLALGHLRDGKPALALYVLARSLEDQGRIDGLGTHPIKPTSPWGPIDGRHRA
jgi:hypothetical protein